MSKAVSVLIDSKYFSSIKKASRSLHLSKETIRERCSSLEWLNYEYTSYRLPEFKICSICNKNKKLSDFYKDKNTQSGKKAGCKECSISNKIKHRKDNPYIYKDRQLKYNYGISLIDYNIMFKKQEGKCLICNKHQSILTQSLCVDHDHETGKIRGLLCAICNKGLGCFKEDIDIINNAMMYLISNK